MKAKATILAVVLSIFPISAAPTNQPPRTISPADVRIAELKKNITLYDARQKVRLSDRILKLRNLREIEFRTYKTPKENSTLEVEMKQVSANSRAVGEAKSRAALELGKLELAYKMPR